MGLGVSTDNIFVADTCNEPSSVKVFSRLGEFKKELEHPNGKWKKVSFRVKIFFLNVDEYDFKE